MSVPWPADTPCNELVSLTSGQVQYRTADTPPPQRIMVQGKIINRDVTPLEKLRYLHSGVIYEPWKFHRLPEVLKRHTVTRKF